MPGLRMRCPFCNNEAEQDVEKTHPNIYPRPKPIRQNYNRDNSYERAWESWFNDSFAQFLEDQVSLLFREKMAVQESLKKFMDMYPTIERGRESTEGELKKEVWEEHFEIGYDKLQFRLRTKKCDNNNCRKEFDTVEMTRDFFEKAIEGFEEKQSCRKGNSRLKDEVASLKAAIAKASAHLKPFIEEKIETNTIEPDKPTIPTTP